MADTSLGNNLISAMGAGAFDVTAMVGGLSEAERAPATARLDAKQETFQAKLDAYAGVKESMTGFKNLLAEIDDLKKLQGRTISSSDESVFTATANSTGVQASPGSYQVEVTSLAKSHSIYSGAFTNTSDQIGTGTLTIRFGSTDYDAGSDTYNSFTLDPTQTEMNITIDSSNDSLIGMRDAINSEDKGVKASIVNDGTGYRLVLTSDNTGSNHSIEVTASDNDGNNTDSSGLSRFTFNSNSTNLAQSSAGTNAAAMVNGLAITSESNTITNVVEGLTLNLKNTSVGSTNTLTIAHDTETVKTAITNFVGDYNALMTVFDEYSKYNDGAAGALQSESLMRSTINEIKLGVSEAMALLPSGFQTMTDVGVTKDRYGVMQLDQDKLDEALANDFDTVARLFTKSGAADNSLTTFVSADEYTQVGSYAVTVTTAGREATNGVYTGATNSYLNDTVRIDQDNERFQLELDGTASSGWINLTQQTYADAEALASEMQNQINADSAFIAAGSSITVSVDRTEADPKFVFTSNKTGSTSGVTFTNIDKNVDTELGITVAAGTAGLDEVNVVVDIQGENETTPWSVTGTSTFQIANIFGDSRGLTFDTKAAAGASFTLNYTEGYASKLDGILERVLDKGEALELRMEGFTDKLAEIEEDRTKLSDRISRMEETWRRQFNAVNTLMGQMTSTGTFLENTFKAMNGGND
jgi:flagellar hook-associated protein 2